MAKKPTRKYTITQPSFAPLKRSKAQKSYFFLDGKLYKKIREEHAPDLLTAWDYENNRTVSFILSDAKRRMKPAFDSAEVGRLLNRQSMSVKRHVREGNINSPVRIFSYGKNAAGEPFQWMKWSEEDILALHHYLLTSGVGRPRKDGTMVPACRLPSRKELLAMMRQQPMFFMQTADGEFVPVWSAYGEV